MEKLQKCYETLLNDVAIHSHATGEFLEQAFFTIISDILIDNGDLSSIEYAYYKYSDDSDNSKLKSMKVDGYSYEWDDEQTKDTMTLIISDYSEEPKFSTFNTTQLSQKLKAFEFSVPSSKYRFSAKFWIVLKNLKPSISP